MIIQEKIFSESECETIINEVKKTENFYWEKSDRRYESSQIYKSNETLWLFEKLKNYFETVTNNKLLNNIERVHFHKFSNNSFFNKHNDLRDERLFSVGVILNNDYEGGEFILYNDKKYLIDKTIGNCYIFDVGIEHEVFPVTKGIRYTIIFFIKKENIVLKKNKTM